MERLLVGLDFSKGSLHAFEYAVRIATVTKAHIRLVWVDNFSSREMAFSKDVNAGRVDAKDNIEELLKEYEHKPEINGIDYQLLKGKVGPEIARHAKEYGADLIIAGTHGITGFEEYWIGSNANRIVIYSNCPVITVRYDYEISDKINRILVPIDSTRQTVQKVTYAAGMAEMFGSEVYLLGIYSTILKSIHRKVDKLVQEAKNYLYDRNIRYQTCCIETENITRDILRFKDKNKIELIAIMTEQETTTSNMLLGKYAHQIVNNSTVPVLSVHAVEKFSLTS